MNMCILTRIFVHQKCACGEFFSPHAGSESDPEKDSCYHTRDTHHTLPNDESEQNEREREILNTGEPVYSESNTCL